MTPSAEEHWERFARTDPYFAVLTDAKYRGHALTDAARLEFFRSGEEHVERVFDTIRTQLGLAFQPARALDFGCGVGRVTIPLATRSGSVVAVDAAETMLAETRRNCGARGITNVDVVLGDDGLSRIGGTFDLVHSYIVFQHIPPRAGELFLQRLVALLAEDGIGVLHVTYRSHLSLVVRALKWAQRTVPFAHQAMNMVRGRAIDVPLMQMHCYALDRVLGILQDGACDACHLQFTRHGPFDGAVIFFRKRRTGAW